MSLFINNYAYLNILVPVVVGSQRASKKYLLYTAENIGSTSVLNYQTFSNFKYNSFDFI